MQSRKLIWPFWLLILASLACQTLAGPFSPSLSDPQPQIQTPSGTPSITQAANPEDQLAVFAELWQIIDEEYLYEDFNGLDWDAIYAEYEALIRAGLSTADFYAAMDEMVWRLGDEHSVFLSPEQAIEEDALYAGEFAYVGVGVQLLAVPERQRAVVLLVYVNSPAAQAGIQPRDSILLADGQPVLDSDGGITDRIRGEAGTPVVLAVQTPGQAVRELTVTRQRIQSNTPVPTQILITPQGQSVGYILLPTFYDETIAEQVEAALLDFSGQGISGLIIDNRINEGGTDIVMIATLRHFLQGTLGYFVNREQRTPLHIRKAQPIGDSLTLPMVVLVGPGTFSFGEVFAGILKDSGRAYLIGETTEGNIETLYGYDFFDGSRAWIAHDTFRPANNPDEDWEETGIQPNLEIPSAWDLYTVEEDPAVQAALDHLDRD